MKSVAVITPTTGKIPNLQRSLNAVKYQDYTGPVKHYVVGDHLNDDKSQEVKELCKATNAVFTNYLEPINTKYEPARIGALRNYGVHCSSEDFIAHLDDDNSFESNHISSLVELLENNPEYDIAHSWRKMVKSDGTDCKLQRYPWVVHNNEIRAKEIFNLLVAEGIFEAGSPIIKDRIISEDDDLNHIDSSEWLMRCSVFKSVKFQEHYTPRQMIYQYTDDYTFCKKAIEQGIRFICSEKVTLHYFLGGFHSGAFHLLEL